MRRSNDDIVFLLCVYFWFDVNFDVLVCVLLMFDFCLYSFWIKRSLN